MRLIQRRSARYAAKHITLVPWESLRLDAGRLSSPLPSHVDPGIQRSLNHMYRDDPDAMYARWGVDAGVAEYMGKAMAALSQEEGPAF